MLEHHLKDAYYLAMNPSTKTSFDPGGQNVIVEDVRTGLTVETIKRALAENLFYAQGKFPAIATKNDFYMALAYTVRDRQLHRFQKCQKAEPFRLRIHSLPSLPENFALFDRTKRPQ
jgi:hypothetical protein